MRLQGTSNQIRLKCPRQIANHEASWHLKDWLFHRVCKHIRDSIRYLYSNPKTTYSQFMVTACKAESQMEEAKDKVRARSAACCHRSSGWLKRSRQPNHEVNGHPNQSRTGQSPTSVPNSPRHRGHGRGQTDRNTPTHPAPTMVRLALVRPPLLTVPLL